MCTFSLFPLTILSFFVLGLIVCVGILLRILVEYPRLEKIAKLLNTEVHTPSFRYWWVSGEYKGRTISVEHSFAESRSEMGGFYIEPKYNVPPEKLFIANYPRPTKHTKLIHGRIRYNFLSLGAVGEFFLNEKKITEIFEELTRASEIVENNLHFYKVNSKSENYLFFFIAGTVIILLIITVLTFFL